MSHSEFECGYPAGVLSERWCSTPAEYHLTGVSEGLRSAMLLCTQHLLDELWMSYSWGNNAFILHLLSIPVRNT